LAWRPSSAPALIASRKMSPVAMWDILQYPVIISAWVPFPAPGGPINKILILASPSILETRCSIFWWELDFSQFFFNFELPNI
jgi:hypothetical protein